MNALRDSGGSKLLFVSEIALICACFYGAAAIDLELDPAMYFLYEGGLERLAFAIASILIAMYFHNLYSSVRVRSRVFLLQRLCEVFGIALVAQSVLSYANSDWILPRWLMIYGVLFSLAAVFAWRVFYSQFVLNIIGRQRILFVGRNATVREIAREILSAPGRGYEILGFVDEAPEDADFGRRLGSFDALPAIVANARPDRIVVGLDDRRSAMPVAHLLQLRYAGLNIEEAGSTFESVNRRVSAADLNPSSLIFTHELDAASKNVAVQQLIDRLLASFLFVSLLPVLAAVAVCLRLGSKGPVLVRYPRIGLNGKPFQLLRFRGSCGSLYRRLHLDASPELVNVMRGEMALVGPRAETPEAARAKGQLIAIYDYRHNVPPGMTGWAQINLSTREQERDPLQTLEYDLYYIKHKSHTLNAYVLMTTLKNRLVWADVE